MTDSKVEAASFMEARSRRADLAPVVREFYELAAQALRAQAEPVAKGPYKVELFAGEQYCAYIVDAEGKVVQTDTLLALLNTAPTTRGVDEGMVAALREAIENEWGHDEDDDGYELVVCELCDATLACDGKTRDPHTPNCRIGKLEALYAALSPQEDK